MSRFDILTILFLLTMVANVIALARHWYMMRVMNIVLHNLIETQKEFNAMMGSPPISPDHSQR